jgi:RND superfamily putative drug exporter
MLRTLSGWCVRHRRLVVLIWFVVLVGASLLGKSVGSAYSNSFQLPHTQSTDAIALLQSAAPKNAGDTENIVVATTGGAKLTDPAIATRVDDMIKKVETLPHVVNVTPYTSPAGAKHMNADGTIAFIPVALNQQINNLTQPEAKKFADAATSVSGGDLHVSVSGQLGELSNPQALGDGTLLGVILALIVLLLVFAMSSRCPSSRPSWWRSSGSGSASTTPSSSSPGIARDWWPAATSRAPSSMR